MQKKRWNDLLCAYLWQYRYTVLLFAGDVFLFAAVLSLYHLEVEAVWYAAALCMLFMLIVLCIHFVLYRKRHKERQKICREIQIRSDGLPKPHTLAEADYQEMVAALKRACDENLTAWQNERQESMDYYITWVHQIKSPISVMRMILQGEDTKEHLELSAELFRIEQYVEMVLSYLRLGSETSDFVFQQYALDDLIRQAIHKYAPQFVRKRIRLSYEPSRAVVLTDEKWLLFIMEQILSNAVKYTLKGSVTIMVAQGPVLKISDTGIGIAPEDIPRVFEKGFTGYNGRADKKSTGLGLYLCRMAADRLSHKISIESEIGAGTTVSIDLHTDPFDPSP